MVVLVPQRCTLYARNFKELRKALELEQERTAVEESQWLWSFLLKVLKSTKVYGRNYGRQARTARHLWTTTTLLKLDPKVEPPGTDVSSLLTAKFLMIPTKPPRPLSDQPLKKRYWKPWTGSHRPRATLIQTSTEVFSAVRQREQARGLWRPKVFESGSITTKPPAVWSA